MTILEAEPYLKSEYFEDRKSKKLEQIKKKLKKLDENTKKQYMEFLNLEESILNNSTIENNRLTRLVAYYNITYKLYDVLSKNLDMSKFFIFYDDDKNTDFCDICYKLDKLKSFRMLSYDLKNLKYKDNSNYSNPFILINHIENIDESIRYYKNNIDSLKKKSVYYDIGMREVIINSVALEYKKEIEKYNNKINMLYDYGKEIKEIEDLILEILSKEWYIFDTSYKSSIKTISDVINHYHDYRSTKKINVMDSKILKKTKFLDICKTMY